MGSLIRPSSQSQGSNARGRVRRDPWITWGTFRNWLFILRELWGIYAHRFTLRFVILLIMRISKEAVFPKWKHEIYLRYCLKEEEKNYCLLFKVPTTFMFFFVRNSNVFHNFFIAVNWTHRKLSQENRSRVYGVAASACEAVGKEAAAEDAGREREDASALIELPATSIQSFGNMSSTYHNWTNCSRNLAAITLQNGLQTDESSRSRSSYCRENIDGVPVDHSLNTQKSVTRFFERNHFHFERFGDKITHDFAQDSKQSFWCTLRITEGKTEVEMKTHLQPCSSVLSLDNAVFEKVLSRQPFCQNE